MSQYEKQWDVPGSTGKTYKVSRDFSGGYACSCPQWIYKRDDCKHIKAVRIMEGMMKRTGENPFKPEFTPTRKELDLIGKITRKFDFGE